MNKHRLYELLRLNPDKIPDEVEFWALYATSFYENLFMEINDPKLVTYNYIRVKQNSNLSRRAKEALKFFYHLRLDELDNPNYWDNVGRKKLQENMKAKLVKESINNFGPMAGSGNIYRSNKSSVVDKISSLEQKIWNECSHEGVQKWNAYYEDILYQDNYDYPDEYPEWQEDEEREEKYWDDVESEQKYWDDLDEFEIINAIEYANSIIKQYKK